MQSEKFLDLGILMRPRSNIYAHVNWSAICGRWSRVQGQPRNLFRRPWIFRLLSLKHHTWLCTMPEYSGIRTQTSLFKFSSGNSQGHISETTRWIFILNKENLDKCLRWRKKKIRLTTPALWLSSPYWAKCMTNSYPLRSPSKRHAKTTPLIGWRPSRECT